MTFASALLGAALLVIQTVAVVAVAVRLARRTAPDEGLATVVIGLLLGLLQIVLVCQVAGALGVLGRPAVFVGHLALATVVLLTVKPAARRARQEERVRPRAAGLVAAAVGLAFVSLAVVLSLHGPSREVDTQHYHLPNTAYFLREGSLWHLAPATPGYWTNAYPSDGELTAAWLIMPSHDDRIVYLAPLAYGVLCVAGAALLAEELRPGRAWAGALGAVAVVAAPVAFHTQVHSLLVDLNATGAFVTGAALALRARRLGGQGQAVALSAAAFGLAIGSKYPVLLPGLLGLGALIVLLPRGRRVRMAGVAAVAAAVPSALWFVRTGLATGNPIFPKGVTIAGAEVLTAGQSPLRVLETTMLDHLLNANWHALRVWAEQARQGYGLVLALIVVGWVVTAWIGITRRDRAALVVAVLAALSFVAYLATPYTGGGPKAVLFLVTSQLRYSLPATTLAAAAGSALLPTAVFAVLVTPALGQDAVRAIQGPTFRPDITPGRRQGAEAAVLFVAAGALWYWLAVRRPAGPAATPGRAAAVLVGTLALIGLVAVGMRALPGPAGDDPATVALRRQGRPHGPVLMVGVANVRPLLGPTLRNHYVTVKDGGAAGEVPILDPTRFDAAVRRINPAVIVVGRLEDTAPPHWQPGRGWTQVGQVGPSRVYAPAASP